MGSLLIRATFGEVQREFLFGKVAKGRLKMGFRRPLVWLGRDVV